MSLDNVSNPQGPEHLNPPSSSTEGRQAGPPESTPPAGGQAEQPPDDAALPPRAWLARNGIYLLLFAALLVLLYRNFELMGMLYILMAALGLGLVIFIHELGHFAVAKWCDVYVETFSIGFGPALPGCRWKRGETVYLIALFPLGGYVKMLGEGETGEGEEEEEKNPRSYKNKSVGQRMMIISAGVIMNVILAIICFIAVYSHGLKREVAVVGNAMPGGPAWQAAVPASVELLQVGERKATDNRPLYFRDLQQTVAFSGKGQKLQLVYRYKPLGDPKAEPVVIKTEVEPREDDQSPMGMMIGLSAAPGLTLPDAPAGREQPVQLNSPAAAAREPFPWHAGDVVVEATDPDNPDQLKPLPEAKAGDKESEQRHQFALSERWLKLAGRDLTLHIRRAGGKVEEVVVKQAAFHSGDTVIGCTDPAHPDQVTELPLDWRQPESGKRDFFELYRRQVLLAGQFMTVRVQRGHETADLVLPPAYHYTLGVRMRMGAVTAIRDRSPGQAAGVKPGDVLKEVVLKAGSGQRRFVLSQENGQAPAADEELVDPMRLPVALRQWALSHPETKVRFIVTRDEQRRDVKELPEVGWDYDERWRFDRQRPLGKRSPLPLPELGVAYAVQTSIESVAPARDGSPQQLQENDVIKQVRSKQPGKTPGETKDGPWESLAPDQWADVFANLDRLEVPEVTLKIERGHAETDVTVVLQRDPTWPIAERGLEFLTDTRLQVAANLGDAVVMGLQDTWSTILEVYQSLRKLVTRPNPNSVGGPLTIGVVAYQFAKKGIWDLLFFIGLISVNLAVINFLPIPFLDGGHMMFLLYEAVRGRPAPESVQNAANLGGVLLLLALMVLVIGWDVARLFFGV
jgi:regulator of sigma E protease